MLEQVGATLFERDRLAVLRSWLERLPSGVFERSPRLAFWLAWAHARSGDFPRAMPLLRIAEVAWADAGDRSNLGLIRTLHAFQHLVSGNSRRAIAEAQDALARLPDERSSERSVALVMLGLACSHVGDANDAERAFAGARMAAGGAARTWVQQVEAVNAGAVLVQQGKLLAASDLLRRVIAAGDQPRLFAVQNALGQLGHVSIELNRLDEAERSLRRADRLVEQTGAIIFGNPVCLGLARLAWARGNVEDAFDEIERALGYAHRTGIVQGARDAHALQAHIWLASGQLALARRWADGCGLDPDPPPDYERRREHLTYARLLIREGRPDLALRILSPIQDQAEATGRDGDLVEVSIVTALAHEAHGYPAEAFRLLHRALELGDPSGYLRVFVDEGEELARLLRRAAVRGDHRDYIRRLLAEIDHTRVRQPPNRSGEPVALGERELDVLRLVADGLANRAIGERLSISDKTVKTHLTHILRKLGAANRTQAVDQARRLGLL
jgi:LuxR family maltose regulon positive regulatory protein